MKNRYSFLLLFAFTFLTFSSIKAQVYLPQPNSSTTNSSVFGNYIPVKEAKVEVNVVQPQEVSTEGGIRINVSDVFSSSTPIDPEEPLGLEGVSDAETPFALWVNRHGFSDFGTNEITTFSVEIDGKTSVGSFNNLRKYEAMLNIAGNARFYTNPAGNSYSELNFKEIRWNAPVPFQVIHGDENNENSIMTLEPTGKVGIGTGNDNLNGNFLLYVNGKILSEEHTVKLKTDWPDYVFEEDYEMLSIEDLEQFIRANKHLPEVPTATYVADHGVDIAATQAALLKHIEELTLRLIEMEKRLKLLEGHESN